MKFPAGVMLGLLLCSVPNADELNLSFNSDALRLGCTQDFSSHDFQAECDDGAIIGFTSRLYKEV